MVKEKININDGGQRLDRYLKKAYKKATLSYLYKMIRKDVKVNGKKQKEDYILQVGDEITIYISEEKHVSLSKSKEERIKEIKRTFDIVFENENLLIVEKPFGLLTHGDGKEKKNTLSNQVLTYLIAKGAYEPKKEKTFVPAPSNRLDRNTTGLVIFSKNAKSGRTINEAIRERDLIRKFYLTIVKGYLDKELCLNHWMIKDQEKNIVTVSEDDFGGVGKEIITKVKPLKSNGEFTLVEVEIPTGRTHQIRSHLLNAGYPLIGDPKYGDKNTNKYFQEEFKLSAQLLHAYKLEFAENLKRELHLDNSNIKVLPKETFNYICNKLRLNMED